MALGRSRAAVVAIAVGVAACGSPRGGYDPQEQERYATDAMEGVVRAMESGSYLMACQRERQVARPQRVLLLTSRMCYSCGNVGLLARRLHATALQDRAPVTVVAPSSDTLDVCDFLRLEKVPGSLPVMSIPDFPRQASRELRSVVVGDLEGEAATLRLKRLVVTRTADEALDLILKADSASGTVNAHQGG